MNDFAIHASGTGPCKSRLLEFILVCVSLLSHTWPVFGACVLQEAVLNLWLWGRFEYYQRKEGKLGPVVFSFMFSASAYVSTLPGSLPEKHPPLCFSPFCFFNSSCIWNIVFAKEGHNNITLPLCSLTMWLCHSSQWVVGFSLLEPGWIFWWPWPIEECGGDVWVWPLSLMGKSHAASTFLTWNACCQNPTTRLRRRPN